MITVTTNQTLDRWDLLPMSLREALYSETNSDFLWRTCEGEHVPSEKIYAIAKIAGYVMMGFLHPEDVALEIVEGLTLDRKTASDIQDALKKRIFTPLQADLDKIYSPLSKFETLPKKIQDIAASGPSPSMVFDMVSGGSAQASLKPLNSVAPKPVTPTSFPIAAPASQKPISAVLSSIPGSTTRIPAPSEGKFAASPLTQAGWSKTTGPVATPGQPTQAKIGTPPTGPAPVILHEDAKFTSSDKTTDFHLSKPGGDAQVSLDGVKSQQAVKPAVLELGSLTNAPTQSDSSAPKFTHYTQFQISTQPIDRHVTEVTGASPKPTPIATPSVSSSPALSPLSVPTAKPAPVAPIATTPVIARSSSPLPPPNIAKPIVVPSQTPVASTPVPKPPMPPSAPRTPTTAMPSSPQPQKPSPPPPQPKVVKVNYP